MGYSALMLINAFLFSPILLLFALVGLLLGQWLRLFDPDVPAAINFLLVGLLGLGLLQLLASAELMVRLPDRIQRDYLGERVAGPFDLRRFEHQPHMMDPGSKWTYALGRADAERLRRRCRPVHRADRGGACVLRNKIGERVFEEAWLTQDGRLHLAEWYH